MVQMSTSVFLLVGLSIGWVMAGKSGGKKKTSVSRCWPNCGGKPPVDSDDDVAGQDGQHVQQSEGVPPAVPYVHLRTNHPGEAPGLSSSSERSDIQIDPFDSSQHPRRSPVSGRGSFDRRTTGMDTVEQNQQHDSPGQASGRSQASDGSRGSSGQGQLDRDETFFSIGSTMSQYHDFPPRLTPHPSFNDRGSNSANNP